jgi:hypothetical protein
MCTPPHRPLRFDKAPRVCVVENAAERCVDPTLVYVDRGRLTNLELEKENIHA